MQPVRTSPDSVALEVFHARIPLDKEQQADALWQHVDEQVFGADLRRQLLANGLRAGVVGSSPPEELSQLLALDGNAPEASSSRVITTDSAQPPVTRQVFQLNRRDRKLIKTSEPRDEAQVLFSDEGRMGGKTFDRVQGVYTLQAEAIAGQRVKLRMTPELQHGEMRMRYSGNEQEGLMIKTPSQEREVFERLALEVELTPGEFLVLGCLPDSKTSLGGVMHTVHSVGQDERKLIVVRPLQVPPSEILAKK